MDVRLPDGTIIQGVPDNISKADLTARLARNGYDVSGLSEAPKPSMGEMFKRELMGSVPVQSAMGALRGAGSIGATLLRPFESGAESEQRRTSMTQGLEQLGAEPSSIAFQAGKLGGEIAGTAGVGSALALPFKGAPAVANALRTGGLMTGGRGAADLALRTGAGALVGGASAGLVNPEDAGTGAMISGMLPGLVKGAGAIGSAVRGRDNELTGLADIARSKYGIPVGRADESKSKVVKGLRAVLNDAPLTGWVGRGQEEAKQAAFNRAVGKTFGAEADSLTPEVMREAKTKIGGELNRIWEGNAMKATPEYAADIADIGKRAQRLLPDQRAKLQSWLDDLVAASRNDEVPGGFVNNWQSELRVEAEAEKGLMKTLMNDLRQSTLKAFNASVPAKDAEQLKKALGQYKAMKTVSPLLDKGEAGVAGRAMGDIPAALLPSQVAQSYRGNISGSPLGELSQIGSRFLVDRTPQTGGSMRAMIQNAMLGGGALAGLTGAGAATGGAPLAAAVIPSAMLANYFLGSQPARSGLLSMSDELGLLGARALPVLAAQP